jgi:hypothetical protein
MTCQEIGQWITDNVETPLNKWYTTAVQQCTDAQYWVEERRKELEDWVHQFETRCAEQECNWWCLCCNKWFCWIVDVLLRVLIVIIELIEHFIAAVCTLLVTIIWVVLSVLVQILKWVVLSVVCLIQSLCPILILAAGIALLVVLLGLVALAVPGLAAAAAPLIGPAIVAAGAALVAARLLCELSRCRIYGVIGWALKWAIVLGALIAVIMLSPLAALIVAVYGGLISALSIALEKIPCVLPPMLGLP